MEFMGIFNGIYRGYHEDLMEFMGIFNGIYRGFIGIP